MVIRASSGSGSSGQSRQYVWNPETLAWEAMTQPGGVTGGPGYEPAKAGEIGNFATRLITVGNLTYIGKAAIGSSQTDPVWQISLIDATAGSVTTWADGDAKFDNIWDDGVDTYAGLSYS